MIKSKEQLKKEGWHIDGGLAARYCPQMQVEIYVLLDTGEYSIKDDRMISESTIKAIKERYPIHKHI